MQFEIFSLFKSCCIVLCIHYVPGKLIILHVNFLQVKILSVYSMSPPVALEYMDGGLLHNKTHTHRAILGTVSILP